MNFSLLSPEAAIAEFLASLTRSSPPDKPVRLLVAVSGGSDSTGLLIALRNQISGAGLSHIELLAVTVDHALRPQSAPEAQAVAELCRTLAIPHLIRRWEGEKPATGISAAARAERYRLLADTAERMSATAILTGHTVDDQIETLVMRHARLSHIDASGDDFHPGLAGMAPAVLLLGRHCLLRPFLGVRRDKIRALLQASGIGWIDDPSNVDPRSERARTRLSLAARPNEDTALLQAAREMAGERRRLGAAAAALFARYLTIEHGVLARLDEEALAAEPAVLHHALASLTAVLGGRPHLPGRDSLRRIVAFAGKGTPGRLTAGRVLFERRKGALFMARESRDLPQARMDGCREILWDGRFRIRNPQLWNGLVVAQRADRPQAEALFPKAPPAVALAACRALPFIECTGQGVSVEPVLHPYDAFLPAFDGDIANSLAALMGIRAFAPLPFNVFDRKRYSVRCVALARPCGNPMLSDK